jgi:hypothetical protein
MIDSFPCIRRAVSTLLSLATRHLYLLSLHFYGMLLRLKVGAVSIRLDLGELCAKEKNLGGIVDPQ